MKRLATLLVAGAALAAAVAQLTPTRATWVDPTTFAAPVSGGVWEDSPPPPPPPDINDGGISSGNANTEVLDIVWSDLQTGSVCTYVSVTGTSTTAEHWSLSVDLDQVPFRGASPSRIAVYDGGTAVPGPDNTVIVTGNQGNGPFNEFSNNTPITSSQTARARICLTWGPPPQGDSSWYTVTSAPSTNPADWSNTKACIVTTVTTTQQSLDENPFFYGWKTTLDLSPAIQRIESTGGVAHQVQWSPWPDGSGLISDPGPGGVSATYQLTSGQSTAIRANGSGRESATVTACVHYYP